MAISKRVLSVIMTVAMLFTIVQVGVCAVDVSAGENVASTQVMVDDGTGRVIAPTVTVTASPVVRVASAAGALTLGTTIVQATPSGVPYISGNYTKEAYAGETPTNATITFKSDLSLANNKNVTITCVNNSSIKFTSTNPDNNTWIWTVTGGTAQAGTYLDFEIGYSYTYTDKLTGQTLTKSYKAYASSYVENIIQPAGVYMNLYRTKSWNHSGEELDSVYRILGINTYGSYYDNGTGDEGRGDNFKKDATVWAHGYYNFTVPEASGWGQNATAADGYGLLLWGKDNGDGNKTGNTGLDKQRPVSTTYIDSSEGTALNGANINLRYAMFDEKRDWKQSEYIRQVSNSTAVLPGEVDWSSYTADVYAGNQLAFAAMSQDVTLLNNGTRPASEFRLTAYGLSIPFNGTTYKDAMTTQSDGTKYISYTFITNLYSKYKESGRMIAGRSAIDLRFYMYNKGELKGLISEALKEHVAINPTGKEIGVNPQESYYSAGWDAYKSALTNAQRVIAKPNVMQADIDAAETALQNAINGLVVKTADYTKVNQALEAVANLDSSLYTPASWKRVADARNAIVKDYTIFYQPAVDKMATDLIAAKDALEYAAADFTNVDNAIEAANAVDRSIYTDASLKALDDLVAEASTVAFRSKKVTEQAVVDAMADSIYDAIEHLAEKGADYTAANEQKARYDALNRDLYTAASLARVDAYYEAIVWNLKISMQAQLDQMVADLRNALDNYLVYKPADYTAVNAAIKKTNNLVETNYTPASWQALQDAINSVERGLNITQQAKVDGFAAAIENAIKNLKYVAGDYTAVINAKNTADALTSSNYTEESWNNLQNVISSVNWNLTIDKQTTIDGYADAINQAIKDLVDLPADYTAVNAYVQEYNDLDKTLYTSASLLGVQQAIRTVVYNLPKKDQSTVDGYAAAIKAALDSLEYKPADYSAVNTALENAKKITDAAAEYAAKYNGNSYYTADSYKALTDAVAAVKTGLDIRYQNQVTGYATAINNAIAALKNNTADYTAVDAALASIPSDLDSGRYTAASVAAVKVARDSVTRGLDTSEQETVDDYAAAINRAVKALTDNDADYSAVEAAKKQIPADSSIYTAESWKRVTDAVDAVVYGLKITEQKRVDAFAAAIIDAIGNLELDTADYSKVETAKAAAKAALESTEAQYYTDASKAAVTTAVNAVVYGLKGSEQARVDGFADAINKAVAALAYKPIDKTGLNAAIARIPSDLSIYTDDTVNALNIAKSAAEAFAAGDVNIKNQAELDAFVAELNKAIDGLTYKDADYSGVRAAIAEADALDSSLYVDFSGVTAAKGAVVYGYNITKQAEVDAMAKAIRDAITALEFKALDTSAYEAAKITVPADITIYTDATVKAVTDAEAAITEFLSGDVDIRNQAQFDALVKTYVDAIANLALKGASYDALKAKIDEFKALNELDYTNYNEAYAVYSEVNTWYKANGNLTIDKQSLIDEQTAKLQAAIDSLIPVPTSYFRAKADSTCIIKGQYIYGLKTNLTTAQLKALYLDYYNVELTIANPKGYRYLGTGSTVTVKYPDGKEEVYTIVIYGDIDGDGRIASNDAAILSSYVSGQYAGEFTVAQRIAANVDGSLRIDTTDVAIISAASVGKKEINQTGATK